MKRWTINLLCLFSLLVFVVTVTVWVQSRFRADRIAYSGAKTPQPGIDLYGISWDQGNLCLYHFDDNLNTYPQLAPMREMLTESLMHFTRPGQRVDHQFAGFHIWHAAESGAGKYFAYTAVTIPLWIFLPSAVPPILWWWRRHRAPRGRGFLIGIAGQSEGGRPV